MFSENINYLRVTSLYKIGKDHVLNPFGIESFESFINVYSFLQLFSFLFFIFDYMNERKNVIIVPIAKILVETVNLLNKPKHI